jgi:glucosylglycerate synthase
MNLLSLPPEAHKEVESLRRADIVIGIPSYNNVKTIAHVVRAVQAGLAKYYPQYIGVIVNSDGGSTDGTREAVLSARVEEGQLLMLSTPLYAVHKLSFPYHGIPGKGSAFRMIFQIAEKLQAKACAVVDSDLRSITPEWVDLLLRPIIHAHYDFVAPYYHRHKYDGTITNSIVYPLTRALYGLQVRQPIGGDFGLSLRLLTRYLERRDWETDVARYGVDIWMTTVAIAEGFRVCQSFLGAKLHDAKDPGADLSAMLQQVVGSVFYLMGEYHEQWALRFGSQPVDLFGFRYDVGLDPIEVNLGRLISNFQKGCSELEEVWSLALSTGTLEVVQAIGKKTSGKGYENFRMEDFLWARIIYEFAAAYKKQPMNRNLLLRSLTPLYLARVASFVQETSSLYASQVEEKIEQLCQVFENQKSYLVNLWGIKFHKPAACLNPPVPDVQFLPQEELKEVKS